MNTVHQSQILRLAMPLFGRLEALGYRLKRRQLRSTRLIRTLVDALLFPSDIVKVRDEYLAVFGRRPGILNGSTFNEKLQCAKLFRRRQKYCMWADKVAVREYVASRVGCRYLSKVYWTGSDILNARSVGLPDRFVIKANQGSGSVLIVKNVDSLDWNSLATQCSQWLAVDHSVHFAEWQYRWIKPCLMIEEFLEGAGGQPPPDFKFFCFNGRVEFIQVDYDRFVNHTRAFYDRSFTPLPFGLKYPIPTQHGTQPEHLSEMLSVAETLAAGEKFLRVDLYDVGRVVFGELTLHPEAGLGRFTPEEWDQKLGRMMG